MKLKILPIVNKFMLIASALILVGAILVTPAAASVDILADFEGGFPAGWFVFQGSSSVTTTTQVIADSDALARPGQTGDNEILEADFNVTDFGGFGDDLVVTAGGPQDWSRYESFNFWFYGSGSGLAYQAEISDNRSDPSTDTSERFDYTFTDDVAGWQYLSIPFEDFTRATDFQPAGAPDDGFTLTEIWAWTIVLPQGVDTVNFDDFALGRRIVDDFENGLPSGVDGNGIPIGFNTFSDGSPVSIATTNTPPAPVPGSSASNNVMALTGNVGSFAGFTHSFENEAVDTWVPQDWSNFEGLSFWLYGQGSGTELFVDILDNRNPGSTSDDAERFVYNLVDDFTGWQYFELPFSSFVRKEIGNGAPNDGLTLTQVHGWALGMLNTGGSELTVYVDDVALYGVAEIPELAVTYSMAEYETVEGTDALITVKLNRELGALEDDPAQVSVDFRTESGTAVPGRDYTDVSGTLTFVAAGPTSQTFEVPTFDNPKRDGDKTAILRLSNPVDINLGFVTQSVVAILDDEEFDPTLLDDFERGTYLWQASDELDLSTPEIAPGDPLALPEQTFFEHVLDAQTPVLVKIVIEGRLCNQGNGVVPLAILTTDYFDALTIDHNTVMFGEAYEIHRDKKTGEAQRHEEDFDGDGDLDLVFHFRFDETGYECDAENVTLIGYTFDGKMIVSGAHAYFMRDFALHQNWIKGEALNFWFYGTNSGDEIGVTLKDNRAAAPGLSDWSMVWSDEFDDPAGTPPNPDYWTYEIGDGAANRIPGWGNDELQYYTSSTDNSATDGNGNLVITAREATGGEQCYYGDCQYTSARLISQYKAEFAYGRIESRILVPSGEAGLWPAFWSLGTDIGEVGWPQTGEIDFMEYVSRLPNEIFGTIHGPGYSGGQSFGNVFDFGEPVYLQYHTFAIEWEPDLIKWYVDGNLYHTAVPSDVAPNEWVFNDPVFLILNMAIGGNFGGELSPDLTFPQEMKVDYVRVYQGPDTAERFEASFVDNFSGWQQVIVPFTDFVRSADQPDGAPDDGLGLAEVWGYGFELPEGGTTTGAMLLDQVRLQLIPPPTSIVVTNLNNSGEGSLRQALTDIAEGGTITFDPALSNGVILLTSPLVPPRNVTVDAADAPGLALDGGSVDRILIVDPGVTATFANLTMTNGYGFQLAGCVLNNGTLTLDHVTVTACLMTTDAGDFWQGGGGIYNGDSATLNLVDSTVSDNVAQWSGGGMYSFFNTTTNIVRSTISGNVSNDVGGGIRSLGNVEIVNSTIGGNTATGWHGGAIFQTDGDVSITNSTIANNIAPDYASSTLFIGQFGGGFVPTLTITNTIITGNQWYACEKFASGTVGNVVSGGYNVVQDDSCNPVASDQIIWDAWIGPLADNGGPTMTHALLAGSPAIDAADNTVCPATDQRGVIRDAACDVGAFEYVP